MALVGVITVHKSGFIRVVTGPLQAGDTFTCEGRGGVVGGSETEWHSDHRPHLTHSVAVYRT